MSIPYDFQEGFRLEHSGEMLEAHSLKKSYGKVVAVDGVSLRAAAGETVGLLGPNGAGKTTTVSMIAGLVHPDSGSVTIEGHSLAGDADPTKRRIGFVPRFRWEGEG